MRPQTFSLPPLYAIIDSALFPVDSALFDFAEQLVAAGVSLVQYRNKRGSARQSLRQARGLRHRLSEKTRLIMNDRADLCLAADLDGVHLGQTDLSPSSVRSLLGEGKIIGYSTHNLVQIEEGAALPADYLAIGPIFSTSSKENPDPEVGLENLRAARRLTRKPLVAIGGITAANYRSVMDAGADSVAVISALAESPKKRVEEFLRVLG